MTPEVFVELQNQINTINQSLSDIKKTVNLLKISLRDRPQIKMLRVVEPFISVVGQEQI